MRPILQAVVISVTLSAPCMVFAQGGSAPATGNTPFAPAQRPGPMIPYMPRQDAAHGALPVMPSEWRPGRFRMRMGEARSASLVSHDASGAESPGGEDAEQEAAPVLPREHGAAHGEHEMYSGGGEHFESLAAWLERMPQEQQVRARAIMEEFFPRLRHLKHQLRAKMRELQVLTYGRETDPQALPALGQELQRLGRQLGQELTSRNHALIREVGSPLPFPPGRGYSSLSRAVPE